MDIEQVTSFTYFGKKIVVRFRDGSKKTFLRGDPEIEECLARR